MSKYLVLLLLFCNHHLLFGALGTRADTEDSGKAKVPLLSLVRRSGLTNEWLATVKRLASTPRWKPGTPIPLNLSEALNLSTKWAAQNGFERQLEVNKVEINRIHGEGDLAFVYYYVVRFVPRIFDEMAVVILMDGTIVEPSVRSAKDSAPNK